MPDPTPPSPGTAGLTHARIAETMRNNNMAFWIWNIDEDTLTLSQEWRRMLVLNDEFPLQLSAEFLTSRMRKAGRDSVREAHREIAAGKRDRIDQPVRIKRFDNTWAWILLRGSLTINDAGHKELSGFAIVVSALRLNKRFYPPSIDDTRTSYHSILEHSPNHIVRFDRELFPLYMNPAVTTMVPFPREELGAKTAAEVGASPEDIAFLQDNVDKVYTTGKVSKVRRSICAPNGEVVFIGDYTFWPEFDATGSVRSVISLQQDLTAEALREQEALANETRFASLYQLTQMTDAPEEEIVRFVVSTIAELTGSPYSHLHLLPGSLRSEGEIVWSKNHYAIIPEENLTGPDPGLIRSEFGFDLELLDEPDFPLTQNSPADRPSKIFFGDYLTINRYLCAPALEDGKVMCIASVYNKPTDYTASDMHQLELFISGAWLVLRRLRYINALKKAKESAERANKVKDHFLANVSHELRTPLNGMLSMLQILKDSPLDALQREYAEKADIAGNLLLRIISDILDFSRMESGRLTLRNAPFDLKTTIASAVDLFAAEAHHKGIDLTTDLSDDLPERVVGDEARVRQIVFNLVSNALKYTERGEIHVSCDVLKDDGDTAEVALTVRDTGIGIPRAMHEKVFEAFTQVDHSSTRKQQGAGLGLGIVQNLTTLMGGSVTLRSEPGNGTEIVCRLPLKRAAPAETENTPETAKTEPTACPSLSVLVAEDDAISRQAMRLFLEKLGHTAVCASNGREALEALRLYPFDCLISDVLMPEMDGLEVTRCIRAGESEQYGPSEDVRAFVAKTFPETASWETLLRVPRDLPVIAVSAHAMKTDREHFLANGMDYYIAKPMALNELAATLRRVYDEHVVPKKWAARL